MARLGPRSALLVVLASGTFASPGASAQSPAPAPRLDWSADDSTRIARLAREGIREARRHAVVWAPRDSMSATWVAALADSLDRGVARLRAVMGAPYAWQRIGGAPVTFYLSPGRFVAHGSGYGAVFIPVSRVHERLAPFLHEASHELLAPARPFYGWEFADSAAGRRANEERPLWLFEGIPDVLAHTVAPEVALHEGDVFAVGGLDRADSTCAARVRASPRGAEVLATVGRGARLAALFTTERQQVAPVFYACGQAFTKYLVDRIGLHAAVGLMPAMLGGRWRAQLERHAGRPVEALRADWLSRIGLADPPR
jgi:hypothetical protein